MLLWQRLSRSRLVPFAVACSLLLLSTEPVSAADRHARERKARTACLNGDYATGVALLSELFVDTKDPTYIFNQGRCFEQNRRYEDAVSRFEEYLQLGESSNARLSTEDKSAAEKHIAKCKSFMGDKAGKPSPTTAAQPEVQVPPMASPVEPLPQPVAPVAPVVDLPKRPTPSSGAGSGLRTTGVITASFGAAALIAGVVFNLKANSIIDDFETKPASYSSSQDSSRKTYETVAWIGYGVGAACVATGAVLFGIGLKAGHNSSTSVALLPAVGDGRTGLVISGGF
jgi:hypothetical protein